VRPAEESNGVQDQVCDGVVLVRGVSDALLRGIFSDSALASLEQGGDSFCPEAKIVFWLGDCFCQPPLIVLREGDCFRLRAEIVLRLFLGARFKASCRSGIDSLAQEGLAPRALLNPWPQGPQGPRALGPRDPNP
jgi:hypothetical protein